MKVQRFTEILQETSDQNSCWQMQTVIDSSGCLGKAAFFIEVV